MHVWRRLAYFGCVVTLLSSCGSSLSGATPQEAVLKTTGLPASIKFHGERAGLRTLGRIVLLSLDSVDAQGQPQPIRHYWYKRVHREWLGAWSAGDGGECASDTKSIAPNSLIVYNAHRHNNIAGYDDEAHDFSVICGRRVVPEVVAVEAQFADGQILRDNITEDMFFIVIPQLVPACTLRIMGRDTTVLHELVPDYTNEEGRNGPPPDTAECARRGR